MFKILQDKLANLSKYSMSERIRWRKWRYKARITGSATTEIQDGVKMRLYYDDWLSEMLYFYGFEENEKSFVNCFLKSGDVFVDVGANIGLFTVIGASLVGNGGKVIAFEPSAKNYGRLVNNVKLNHYSNVTCNKVALSDLSGKAKMTVCTDKYGAWNSLAKPSVGTSFETETVETVCWDEYSEENGLTGSIALMKIDVEGWEYNVLQGARKALSRNDAPVLLVEFTDTNARNAGHTCQEIYTALTEFGYEICEYSAETRKLVEAPLRDSYPYMNLVATKIKETVEARLAHEVVSDYAGSRSQNHLANFEQGEAVSKC